MSDPEDAALPEAVPELLLEALRRARREISDDSLCAMICLEERIAWLRARVELLLEGRLEAALIRPDADPNDPANYTYGLPADDSHGRARGREGDGGPEGSPSPEGPGSPMS